MPRERTTHEPAPAPQRREVVALGLVAGAVLLLGGSGAAGADGPPAQLAAKGWWWEAQADQLPAPVPAPPNVAAGQLYVQGDPTGKSAYDAAVRYTVDASHTATSLTLAVGDNGNQGGSSAVVLACRTGSAWTAAEAGKWSAAPEGRHRRLCERQRSTDGKTWTFSVKTLQVGSTVDVAIIPGVDPTTTTTSTFALAFNAPADDSLASEAGSPPPVTAPPTRPLRSGAMWVATAPATGGGSTFHPPAVAPIATGLPADKVGQTATSPANQAASQANLNQAIADSTPAKDRDKKPGYLVLALAAGLGLYAWRQDNLMAMNGGALPGAQTSQAVSPLFSRPRHGSPPALT